MKKNVEILDLWGLNKKISPKKRKAILEYLETETQKNHSAPETMSDLSELIFTISLAISITTLPFLLVATLFVELFTNTF